MSPTPEEIASLWREQMQRGYLKLAILFVLTKGPVHGYQLIKRISEWSLGMIRPTAGGLYPTLKELENKDLIQGKWVPEGRRKVYHITDKGRNVFKEAMKRHFELAQSIRGWFFRELADLQIVEEVDLPQVMPPAIRVLLLNEKASVEEKIEALKKLRARLQHLADLFYRMADQIVLRIDELKSK